MSLYSKASLVLYPDQIKASKLYSLKPTDGTGDLTFTRASTATRVNANGLIEDVASGVPRIDYSDGGCGKLLLEPQRTNLLTYSEDIDNAAWSKTNCTVSANAETSPDGATTADKIIPNNGVDISGQASYVRRLFSTSSGVSYKISFYAKSAGYDTLFLFTNIGGNITVTYNLSSNWQRYELSVRVGDGNTKVVYFGARDASVANGTDGVLLWGVQIEQGSYPTSYIPTSGAAVTRVYNDISSDLQSSSVWDTSLGGTFFIDLTHTLVEGYVSINTYGDSIFFKTGVGTLGIVTTTNGAVSAYTNVGGYTNFGNFLGSGNVGDVRQAKIAITFTNTTVKTFANGSLISTKSKDIRQAMEVLKITLSRRENIYDIKSFICFQDVLSDTELAELTTL